jgi:hypothetical protein
MNPKKEAEKIPKEQREAKTAEYLKKTANNLKEVGIKDKIKEVKTAYENILKTANGNDYTQLASILTEVNKLWNEGTQGGDINAIVKKIKNLR